MQEKQNSKFFTKPLEKTVYIGAVFFYVVHFEVQSKFYPIFL